MSHLFPDELRALTALVDRIVPADEYPGASDAGVIDYIVGQFDRDLHDRVPLYREGLKALDREAVARYGAAFADLDTSTQDLILHAVEAGKTVAEWPVSPRGFFDLAVANTTEGYYADPGNGGNRDEVSWRMIGFGPYAEGAK